MSLLPTFRTKYGANLGVELFFQFPDLNDDPKSYLDADSAAGASSLTANGLDFSTNQFIVIGQPGNEKAEIVQVNNATSTSITLVSPASFAHNRGDVIRFIPYSQIVLEFSTDAVTYTAASAISIRADATETYLQRNSDLSTYSYRFRFYNPTLATYSAYSDIAQASGYADNTIWSVKNRALTQIGEKKNQLITDQFLNDSIQEGRRTIDQNPAVLRWSFRTKFNATWGQLLSGQWSMAVPTDLRDKNTYKNILSLRIGSQNRPVQYQDRMRFNQNYLNIEHSTTVGTTASGATSIRFNSTHDFDASGAVTVANNSVGDGLISFSYTGNNKTTNTLTGVTGITRTITAGTDVWQRGVFGLPTWYTIDNGIVYFDVPLKVDYDGQDVKGDYYSQIPAITTDDQQFDEPFYDLYVPYLKYRIKDLKANGKIDRDGDSDYRDFMSGVGTLVGQEVTGQVVRFVPDVDGYLSAVE